MKSRVTIQRDINRGAKGLALGLVVLLASGVACASDDPPFQPDTHWVPFSHYKTGDKDTAADEVTDEVAFPKVEPEPPPPPPAPAVSAIAAPKRPIDLPILPGLNKGFAVHVNSTDDDYVPPPASAGGKPIAPDIHLSEKKWADPVVTAHSRKADDSEDNTPLNVRMSFLPNQKITPIPSPEHPSALELGRAELLKKGVVKKKDPKQPPAPTPEDAAACAALEAYKKQQLDAIQGDRQTLQALQDAIKSLGLQKQLGFIAGSESALSTPMPQSPATIDIPASTPTK